MNKKNRNFEDILLTRAFEEYLRREDEKLPSDEELREEFPPREEECRKYSVMARRGERRFSAIKTLKWVAVIILAAISVSFAGLMMNENVRAAVFGVFVGRHGDGTKTSVSFLGDGFFEGKDMFDLTVGYVPEGLKTFELSKENQEQITQGWRLINICSPDDPDPIYHATAPNIQIIIQATGDGWDWSDKRWEDKEELTINGMIAFRNRLDTVVGDEVLPWGRIVFGDKNLSIQLMYLGVDDDEVLKVAESIR